MSRHGRWIAAVALAVGILVGSIGGLASPAQAVSCYGHYCTSKDPNKTGCAKDAKTLHSIALKEYRYFIWQYVGKLELRYSPTCKTKWARATTTEVSSLESVRVTQTGGYNKTYWVGGNSAFTNPGTFYTMMIYSPTKVCRAHVTGPAIWERTSTNWK